MKSFILLALISIVSSLAAVASDRPNVIVILADDMGIDSVSAFNDEMGIKTPAIDQLAREGMSFTDAHSTSGVCSPTRYSVLTGRYNWRSRLKRGIVGKWERPLIEDQRLTLPEMLRAQGYDTACIGKWHLGWHWPKKGGGTTSRSSEIDFAGEVQGGPNDHGFQLPFIVRWPGKIDAGTSCDQTITLADIMATCAAVAGHNFPEDAAEDSVSLLPVLRGDRLSEPLHEAVVHHSVSGHFAIRQGKWKLLLCRGSGGWSPPREAEAARQKLPAVQLYNLNADPKETRNLQADHQEVVQELTAVLRRIVEQGRSTPGPQQPNHAGAKWWPGLPWSKP